MKLRDKSSTKDRIKVMLILIAMLLFGSLSLAQPKPFDFIIYGGIDVKMLTVGAHPQRQDKQKGLDYKLGIGFDWENTRLRTEIQSFKEINFTKWTYLAFDYKLQPIQNFYLYAGAEISQIKRGHPYFDGSDPNNYREFTINPVIFGINLEVQYRYKNIGFGIQGNIHQAEDELKKYKKYRKQVHFVVFVYL